MALSAQINVALKARLTGSADLSTPEAAIDLSGQYLLAAGTGDNQIDVVHADAHSMAQSATKDYDLSGSLTNPIGDTAVFAKVKAIAIKAGAANPGNLKVGADAAAFAGFFDDASDELIVPPGQLQLLLATKSGLAVTATTADIVQVASESATGTYTFDIVFLGASA